MTLTQSILVSFPVSVPQFRRRLNRRYRYSAVQLFDSIIFNVLVIVIKKKVK